MTLLLAILIIVGLDISLWWILAAIIVWIVHVWFHDQSGQNKAFNHIFKKQHKILLKVQSIERKIL